MHDDGARKRLVYHINELERLEARKKLASDNLKGAFETSRLEGYDVDTLKVVLKLRKLTAAQRLERRALEAIYLAAIGLLDGEAMPDEARRRLSDEEPRDPASPRLPDLDPPPAPSTESADPPAAPKDPADARKEGAAAAAAGKRIYDNPYAAGDPCRAAWDEGWCGQRNSHGMDVPQAYQRRRAPKKKSKDGDRDADGGAA